MLTMHMVPQHEPNFLTSNNALTFTDSNQLYYFTSVNTCGSITDSVQVMVFGYAGQAFGDTTICSGDTTYLFMQTMEKLFLVPCQQPIQSR